MPALPLQSLEFVKNYISTIDTARDTIIQEMESMVVSGLADLVGCLYSIYVLSNLQNQPLLSSSLQTAHNLHLLPDLVSNLLADLNDAVTLRISKAFDSAAIGKEVAGRGKTAQTFITDIRHIDLCHQIHLPAAGDRADFCQPGPMGQHTLGTFGSSHRRCGELLHQSLHT